MQQVDLPCWEAFEERVRDLFADRERRQRETGIYVSDLLFRGHSSSQWDLKTTLERDAPHLLKASEYYHAAHAAKYQIESLTGQHWDLPSPPEYRQWLDHQDALRFLNLPGYDYLIYLRHHGFPSPLLDWSRSPFVAAFFAFRHAFEEVPHVSIYAFLEHAGDAKSSSPTLPGISGQGPYVRTHRRHVLQQCEYTICTVQRDGEWYYVRHDDALAGTRLGVQDLAWQFNIPSSERLKVLRLLDGYNVNAFSLFGSEESLMETVAFRELQFRWRGV